MAPRDLLHQLLPQHDLLLYRRLSSPFECPSPTIPIRVRATPSSSSSGSIPPCSPQLRRPNISPPPSSRSPTISSTPAQSSSPSSSPSPPWLRRPPSSSTSARARPSSGQAPPAASLLCGNSQISPELSLSPPCAAPLKAATAPRLPPPEISSTSPQPPSTSARSPSILSVAQLPLTVLPPPPASFPLHLEIFLYSSHGRELLLPWRSHLRQHTPELCHLQCTGDHHHHHHHLLQLRPAPPRLHGSGPLRTPLDLHLHHCSEHLRALSPYCRAPPLVCTHPHVPPTLSPMPRDFVVEIRSPCPSGVRRNSPSVPLHYGLLLCPPTARWITPTNPPPHSAASSLVGASRTRVDLSSPHCNRASWIFHLLGFISAKSS